MFEPHSFCSGGSPIVILIFTFLVVILFYACIEIAYYFHFKTLLMLSLWLGAKENRIVHMKKWNDLSYVLYVECMYQKVCKLKSRKFNKSISFTKLNNRNKLFLQQKKNSPTKGCKKNPVSLETHHSIELMSETGHFFQLGNIYHNANRRQYFSLHIFKLNYFKKNCI